MRQTRTWTISLPPAMEREATALARTERRTKSELIREALRTYMASQKWKGLQQLGAVRAQRKGIRTEAELDRIIHELRSA